MATHRVEPGLARLFNLGIDGELPKKVEEWKAALAKGELTDEMVRVFHGLGWLSSLRDPRIERAEDVTPDASPAADAPPTLDMDAARPDRRHRGGRTPE
jgi:hypothetical protein